MHSTSYDCDLSSSPLTSWGVVGRGSYNRRTTTPKTTKSQFDFARRLAHLRIRGSHVYGCDPSSSSLTSWGVMGRGHNTRTTARRKTTERQYVFNGTVGNLRIRGSQVIGVRLCLCKAKVGSEFVDRTHPCAVLAGIDTLKFFILGVTNVFSVRFIWKGNDMDSRTLGGVQGRLGLRGRVAAWQSCHCLSRRIGFKNSFVRMHGRSRRRLGVTEHRVQSSYLATPTAKRGKFHIYMGS